jgi:hypothetical protein
LYFCFYEPILYGSLITVETRYLRNERSAIPKAL